MTASKSAVSVATAAVAMEKRIFPLKLWTREIRFMYECAAAMHRHSFVLSSVDEFMNGIQTKRHHCAVALVTIQNNMHHAMGKTMKIH